MVGLQKKEGKTKITFILVKKLTVYFPFWGKAKLFRLQQHYSYTDLETSRALGLIKICIEYFNKFALKRISVKFS